VSLTREISRRLPGISAQLVLACLSLYFAYHAVEGDRGLNAWWQLSQKVELAQATLNVVSSQRAALEARAALVGQGGIDPDMLEEQARVLLNFGRADEIVIMLPKGEGVR